MKQKQLTYLIVLSRTAVFYRYFWYLYSTTCKKCVHVVEKTCPQLCFNQRPQYSLALCALIRILFCEYGPLGNTAVVDVEVMVGLSSTPFHSGISPSGLTMMGRDVHGATVHFTVMFTIAASPPRGSVVSVGSGYATQEMQVIVSWSGTHDSTSNSTFIPFWLTCTVLLFCSYPAPPIPKHSIVLLYKHHSSIWSHHIKFSMLRVRYKVIFNASATIITLVRSTLKINLYNFQPGERSEC